MEISLHPAACRGHDGHEALKHGVADADAEEASGDGEQKAFGESCSKMVLRLAPSALRTASSFWRARPAGEEKIGDVDAGDEQDEGYGAEEKPERLLAFAGEEVVLERLDEDAPALVAFGVGLGDVGGD